MNIYIVQSDIFNKKVNPYTRTLVNGILSIDKDVSFTYGLNQLWTDEVFNYEIVHFMWPDECLLNHTIDELKERLIKLRSKNIKIVATCHNIRPHYCNDSNRLNAYTLCYSYADMIFHMGSYSCDLFKKKFPGVQNIILQHHVLDKLYPTLPSRVESITKLNLRADKRYILCFGNFRSEEERKMIVGLSRMLESSNISIIAPRFYPIPRGKNFFKKIKPFVKTLTTKLFSSHILVKGSLVSDEMLPYYFGAADVVFLQRLIILNSGNLPLSMFMGKVVVGPNVGNVGRILTETGNPTFIPGDNNSVFAAVIKAFALAKEGKGVKNNQYALDNWSTAIVSKKLFNYYNELISL